MTKKQKWAQWMIGAGMASLFFALIALFGDLRYAGNDDSVILRPFMGFGALAVPAFHGTLHPILSYPLNWLSTAFPGVAWFSWMQLTFLWFACTLSVKSIVGCFHKKGFRPAWGVLAGTVYLVCFAAVYCCHVTFTVTAAVLGASAVLQILSVDGRCADGQAIRGFLLALVPVALAYGLRQISALPILAFCGLALAYVAMTEFGVGKSRKRSWRPLFVSLAAVAVAFVLLAGGRALEIKARGMEEYMRWQDASSEVMDYTNVVELPESLLEEVGWSPAEAALINEWYFMDRNITADAFEKIAAYNASQDTAGVGAKLSNAVRVVGELARKEPVARRSLWVLLAALLLAAAGLAWKGKRVLWQGLCLLGGIALAAALLLYLGWRGRLPLRAGLTAFLPLAALTFGMLPMCLPEKMTGAGRAALLGLAALTLAATAFYAVPAMQSLAKVAVKEEDETTFLNPTMDLDELAAENPDILYIYDPTLAADTRMFPSTAFGTPENVLFWGGWNARSPQYREVLGAFGIDSEDMDATIFLREDVCLARGVLSPDPVALINYLSELCGGDVEYMQDTDWGGVHTAVFYE